MKRARLAAVGAAALVLVSVGVSLATPGDELAACRSQQNGKSQVTVRPDRWVRIGAPKFDATEGPATLASFSALPYRPNGLLVTNGRVIKLSVDAGCTWETVYRGNNVRAPAPGYTPDVFTQLVSPNDTSTWVTSYDDIDGVPHPHVYVGSDIAVDGKTPAFGQLDVGLPAYGRPVSLAVAPLGLGEAYFLVDELPAPQSGDPTTATRHLYTTYTPNNPPQAGAVTGRAWKEITPPAGFGRIDGVTRQDVNSIWIWSGRTYAYARAVDTSPVAWHVGSAPGPIAAVDVDTTGIVSVVAHGPQGEVVAQPDSHGRLVPQFGIPVVPSAFAHGSFPGVYVASGPQGTWGLDHLLNRWIDISPRGGPTFGLLAMAPATTARVVLGLTPSALWRWDAYRDETFREPPAPPQGIGDPNHPLLPTSTLTAPQLTPSRQVVTVAPGAVRNVPVTFRVPPAPTPLDVYFLVDTTYSMGPAILGLQRAINSIALNIRSQLGVSACFGVGDVKDLSADSAYVFKTLLPVSPCDNDPALPKVSAAVAQLKEGGGGDTPEAQTIGLSQAVTGTGQTYVPVPAGQQAGFRHGAFKVVVLVSDAPSHQGSGYPTLQETVQTLSVADVKVVSIAVNDGGGDFRAAKAMMTALATGTGSYSPPAGVDCNGDGGGYYGDLGPGEPLVCEVSATSGSDGSRIVNIGPAILGLLLAVKDPGTLEVQVDDPDGALRAPIVGLTSDIRDLKYENGLHFTLPVGCGVGQVGRTLPVGLTPLVRSHPIGLRGEVLVQCRAPALLPVLPPVAAAVTVLAIPTAARPPVGVAVPAPPNPLPQAPGNLNLNAGMSHQEEEQAQLATAVQDANEASDPATDVVAMSARVDPSRRTDLAFVLGAASLLSAAAGCQLRLRRRPVLAKQRR